MILYERINSDDFAMFKLMERDHLENYKKHLLSCTPDPSLFYKFKSNILKPWELDTFYLENNRHLNVPDFFGEKNESSSFFKKTSEDTEKLRIHFLCKKYNAMPAKVAGDIINGEYVPTNYLIFTDINNPKNIGNNVVSENIFSLPEELFIIDRLEHICSSDSKTKDLINLEKLDIDEGLEHFCVNYIGRLSSSMPAATAIKYGIFDAAYLENLELNAKASKKILRR